MSTIRFAMFSDDYIGHLNPLIGIAQRLIKAGHSVSFFGPGALAHHVLGNGLAYHSMPCLLPRVYSREEMESTGRCSREEGENAVARRTGEILGAVREIRLLHQPDVAVFDSFMLCLLPAFAITGMKCVAVSIAPLLTPDPWVPPYTSGIMPAPGLANNPAISAAWEEQELAFKEYEKYSCEHEKRFGWSNKSLVKTLSSATNFPIANELISRHVPHDLNFKSIPEVVVHAQEFEFPRLMPLAALGAYLGPCTTVESCAAIYIPGTGPLIYCQLGTVGSQQDDGARMCYQKILQIIALKENWRAIVVISNATMLKEMQSQSSLLGTRVLFTHWINQPSALLQADVMISNAGDSSVKEAILAGTPILAIPRHFDQHGVAARVAFHGLGIVSHPYESEHTLEKKISSLICDPTYRKKIDSMRHCFLKYDENRVCERVFESIAEGNLPKFED